MSSKIMSFVHKAIYQWISIFILNLFLLKDTSLTKRLKDSNMMKQIILTQQDKGNVKENSIYKQGV